MKVQLPLVLALALAGPAAQAAWVQTSFAGVVTDNNPLASGPALGSTISGQFTIDPAVLGGEGPNCAATSLCWSGPDSSWGWNGATVTLASQGGGPAAAAYGIRYDITDSAPGAGPDVLVINLGGFNLTTVKLSFSDATGTAFEAGPAGVFASKTFSFVPLCVTGIGCALNPRYAGDLTSLVAVPVPEPASAALMLLGGAGLVVARRRRRA